MAMLEDAYFAVLGQFAPCLPLTFGWTYHDIPRYCQIRVQVYIKLLSISVVHIPPCFVCNSVSFLTSVCLLETKCVFIADAQMIE
jgi:hypothetical protein